MALGYGGPRHMSTAIDFTTARRIAVAAALLDRQLPPTEESVVEVARHFDGIQIDPTRTVERTQYLVLWSRLGNFDRSLVEKALADRRVFEWNAFIVPVERLPELLYVAREYKVATDWRRWSVEWIATNKEFHQSILDQLRAEGPLQSRQLDDSMVKEGWRSTGWTNEKNSTRMLEFMGARMEVVVAGRVGQERLWDLPERVIPADAPRDELTQDEYEERRVMRAMQRFGVATQQEIRLRAYGMSIPAAKALLSRLVEEGRLVAVDLPYPGKPAPAFALPEALESAAKSRGRTTLLSPFEPLIYDRDRTERLFGFKYKLEMYVPKAERQFGHFVLPILHDGELVGRLDSERDRKTNELQVIKLHWEDGAKPSAATRTAVDDAIAKLAEFVRLG